MHILDLIVYIAAMLLIDKVICKGDPLLNIIVSFIFTIIYIVLFAVCDYNIIDIYNISSFTIKL